MSLVEQKLEQRRRLRRPGPGIEARAALSTSEACDFLNIGITTLYRELQSGRLPFRKIGRKTIILKTDAEAWLRTLPTGLQPPVPNHDHRRTQPEPHW